MWVRGLKPASFFIYKQHRMSHPVWVRGLKHKMGSERKSQRDVAPRVGAWIETSTNRGIISCFNRSHPVWVRGLKLVFYSLAYFPVMRRTPCGCVD